MKCLRCNNEDPNYFYLGHSGYYCRKCVKFLRTLVLEDLEEVDYQINSDVSDYELSFNLTNAQKEIAQKCLENIKESDILLNCVCGAGKTEIVVSSISEYLNKGLKVCYAISRKEVVKELALRFQKYFNKANVIAVFGGHHNEIFADLIVCTTHQLFRYYHCFDLLILDEVDAYPLKGNETLFNIAMNSCKGHVIFSTATIDKLLMSILNKRKYLELKLNVRPSYQPLVIPKIYYLPFVLIILLLFVILKKEKQQCLIFVSSKRLCRNLYFLFKNLLNITYVYSDLDKREENISDFKNKKYQFIITTTVLERGITINDVDVIIISDNKLFDMANYVQMLGRVGRNIDNPYGNAYILSDHFDLNIIKTIKYLKEANSNL